MRDDKNLLFKIICFFLILLFVITIGKAKENSTEDITFVVMGHVYPDYEALNQSIELIKQENPDFIVFLGDSLIESTVPPTEIKDFITKVKCPVYFVPGNHDIHETNPTKGYYIEELSKNIYYNLSQKGFDLIFLSTVTNTDPIYDISNEQVDFIKSVYKSSDKQKIIFMHHCLFYNYDNQFCNSKPYIDGNNWNNNIVQEINNNQTIAIFVGDVGVNEPYFGYEENNLSYFGVGFSAKESQLKTPQHFLKVTINKGELSVSPIPIRQDLTKVKYYQRVDKRFFPLFKSFIKKNLGIVLETITVTIAILLLVILILLILLFKHQKSSRSRP